MTFIAKTETSFCINILMYIFSIQSIDTIILHWRVPSAAFPNINTIKMSSDFQGKTIVVTGAGQGM